MSTACDRIYLRIGTFSRIMLHHARNKART